MHYNINSCYSLDCFEELTLSEKISYEGGIWPIVAAGVALLVSSCTSISNNNKQSSTGPNSPNIYINECNNCTIIANGDTVIVNGVVISK